MGGLYISSGKPFSLVFLHSYLSLLPFLIGGPQAVGFSQAFPTNYPIVHFPLLVAVRPTVTVPVILPGERGEIHS